jgi:RNA polymerase subunit RPABC4/transcription elongation factor Spt4
MMEEGCEHLEGSPIGKCAICTKTVCSECYRTVFSEVICDEHESLEEESAWELVGLYADSGTLDEKRFELEEHGIVSIVVEDDEDAVELYVPAEEKEDGYAALKMSGDDAPVCAECMIQYSPDTEVCPICGKKTADAGEETDPIQEFD